MGVHLFSSRLEPRDAAHASQHHTGREEGYSSETTVDSTAQRAIRPHTPPHDSKAVCLSPMEEGEQRAHTLMVQRSLFVPTLERSSSAPNILVRNAPAVQHSPPKRIRALSMIDLAGKGASIGQPEEKPKKSKSNVRNFISKFGSKKKEKEAASSAEKGMKSEPRPQEVNGWRDYYTNFLIQIAIGNPLADREEIAAAFLAQVNEQNRPLLQMIGLDSTQGIQDFLQFVEIRGRIEADAVVFKLGFDSPRPISQKSVGDILSSFRCAEQKEPPEETKDKPYLKLNGHAVPLPDQWDQTAKGFFSWLFHHCNAAFNISESADQQAALFCDHEDASRVPYLLPLQAFTIHAYAPAAMFLLKVRSKEIEIIPPHQQTTRYQIDFDPQTQAFRAIQIKPFLLKHNTEGGLGEIEVHWIIEGRLGENQVSATLQFQKLEFSMEKDVSLWYQAVKVLEQATK